MIRKWHSDPDYSEYSETWVSWFWLFFVVAFFCHSEFAAAVVRRS